MKRLLSILLALLLLFSLCSCAGAGAPQGDDPPSGTDTQEEPAQTDSDPASTDPEPSGESDPLDEGDLPKHPPFDLEQYAVPGCPGFYDLSQIPEVGSMQLSAAALTQAGTVILLTGVDEEQLWTLDLESGELTQLAVLPADQDPEWSTSVILSVDPLIIYDYIPSALYLVKEDGSVTTLSQGNGEVVGSWDYAVSYAVSQDAYFFYQTGTGCLLRTPLDGGETETVFQAPLDYFYIQLHGLTPDQKEAVFSATTADGLEILMTVSLSSGEITHFYHAPLDEYGSPLADGVTGKIATNSQPDENDPMLHQIICTRPGQQVSATLDLELLQPIELPPSALDAQEGAAPEEDALPEEGGADPDFPEGDEPTDPEWPDGYDGDGWYDGDFDADPFGCWVDSHFSHNSFWGQSVLCAYNQSEAHLLLWDYRDLTPQAIAEQPLTAYEPPAGGAQEIFAQRAKALEDTYGISIHMGEDIAAPFPDYTLSECQDVESTKQMMDVLEEALSLYPEDYFTQLGGDSVRGFSFYFSGEMTPLDPSVSISAPAGLTCQVDGVELIAFDITGYIQVQDVVHELTHVLDHWLWEDCVLDDGVWCEMNPDDFSYYYAYVDPDGVGYDVSGSTEYTSWSDAYYDGDVESVYFVDPYSTTYPTEDRARLMEYLLANADYAPPDYYSSTHVQAKLTYYFQCIREKFDTANWPEQTSWEAALAKVASEG